MIEFIADNFYYLFLAWLVLNLMQRKHRSRGEKKRTATLIQAIMIFIVYIGALIIREEGFEPKWIMIPFAVDAALLYFFRERILPYKRNCVSCGAKLNMNQIFIFDANLCSKCDPDEQPGEQSDAQGDAAEADDESAGRVEAAPLPAESAADDADDADTADVEKSEDE